MNGPHDLVTKSFDAVMSGPKAPVDSLWGYAFRTPLGDLVYSPNCSRHVKVPPVSNDYPFRRKLAKLESFLSPRWWTDAFGYLAFIPLRPSFDGLALGCLEDVLSHVEKVPDGRYGLTAEKAGEWRRLEDLFLTVSHFLKIKFSSRLIYPSLRPTPPSFLGFEDTFDGLKIARHRLIGSRDWFLVWTAYLSFLLANLQTGSVNREDWFSALALADLPQSWLSSLQSSMVCQFSNHLPRVGVFLDICSPTRHQPEVKWFFAHHIPVWYHWGPAQEKFVAQNVDLAYTRPPPELWQQVMTFITREPSGRYEYLLLKGDELSWEIASKNVHPLFSTGRPPSGQAFLTSLPSGALEPTSPAWSAVDAVNDHGNQLEEPCLTGTSEDAFDLEKERDLRIAKKPWRAFFDARAIINHRKLLNETAKARHDREQREKKPPTVSAEVFVWDWDPDNLLKLVRSRVNVGERERRLGTYGVDQCLYDAFSNEWDVCLYFGSSTQGAEDDESVDDNTHPEADANICLEAESIPPVEEVQHQALIDERVLQGVRSLGLINSSCFHGKFSYTHIDLLLPSGTLDIVQYLSDHYSFVAPIPRPVTDLSPVSLTEWNECMKSVGLRLGDHNFPITGLSGIIITFIRALQSSQSQILVDNSDLLAGNRQWIKPLVNELAYKLGGLFVIKPSSLDPAFPTPWLVAVCSAVDLLFVIRILRQDGAQHSSASLILLLADKGIRCHTPQRLDIYQSTISIDAIDIQIPRRLAGYVFYPSDYQEYVARVKSIFRGPRSRAALLYGGIIGRLAREFLGTDSAALGPSPAVLTYRLGCSFQDSTGDIYWDDALSTRELEVICGMHHCFTGHGQEQMAKLSWWPLPEYWDHPSNGYNWGSWTEWDEAWYQTRLSAILRGDRKDGVPLNHNVWRSKLKGAPVWKKVTASIRALSHDTVSSL